MRFKRHIHLESGLKHIDIAPLIDIVFLLLIFFALTSSFTVQTGIDVKLPKAVTSGMITEQQMTVTISDEDVLYFNGAVVSPAELKEQLQRLKSRQVSLLIKADRRASVGRIVDVWDLCRQLGFEKINIAANQRN